MSEINLDAVTKARLVLNAVPTNVGIGILMPKVSEFGVYGIPDDERENWPNTGLLWKDAPQLKNLSLLESFSIPRANLRKVIVLEGPELLAFLKADRSGEIGFIIHCETPGKSMVHGFASSQHSEVTGPTLELITKEE